jgi:peptidoglycan pentaglycine glycine transferase (the first glycine)
VSFELNYIDDSLQNEWENLVKKNPASGYMQSFFWADLKRMLGWETFKIGVFEKNKLIGGAIVGKYSRFKNRSFLIIPEGPVLPYEKPITKEVFEMLISEVDKIANLTGTKLSSHLSIEPELLEIPTFFKRFVKSKFDNQPLKTLVIDLSLSEDEILRQMKPKGRYNIKIGENSGAKILVKSLNEGINDFIKLYQRYKKRSNFETKDNSYFQALAYCVPEDCGEIFLVEFKNTILAAAIVIYWGEKATFLFGANSDNFKNVMASYFLQFEIIKHAKKSGYKIYDLYGLAPNEEDLNHPWHGFSVFKRKLGGREIKYIGGYDFIYNKKLYEEFNRS